MLRCPKCATESPDRARFCRACGQALPTTQAAGGPPRAGVTAEDRARRLLEEAFRLSEEGKVLAAIQACQQAVAINPNSTSAHSLLGTLYERQGDRDNAIREYEQVLTLSPGSTVERRRLNELMGIPAAREAVLGVSPRTARLAVSGAALVVALVLIAAVVLTTQERPQRAPVRAQARPQVEEAALAQPSELGPTPGSIYQPFRRPPPRLPTTRPPAPRLAPARTATTYGGATWLAPGTFLLPTVGGPRPPGPRRPSSAYAPPFIGAVPVAGGQPPAVGPAGAYAPVPTIPIQLGRNYYFQGDYQRSIAAYRAYLAQNPGAGAAPREELAWIYTESGNRQQADQLYRSALEQYQSDLGRGHNVEAARHGVRTCESALKVLESR